MRRPKLQGSTALRTAARPVAQVEQAAEPVLSPLGELASALSEFEPALQDFIAEEAQTAKRQEFARAKDTIGGMTFEEAKKAVDEGTIRETESPWFDAAFRKQFGIMMAGKRKQEIVEAYNNGFDKDNGNIDEFLAQYAKTDAMAYGEDKFISAGMRDNMRGFFDSVKNTHADYLNQKKKGEASQRFIDVARDKVLTGLSQGMNPSQAVRSLYEEHRTLLGLTYQEMDTMTMKLAEEFARNGEMDIVESLITTEITGADGQKVGSFTSRAQFADAANGILELAKGKWAEKTRLANMDLFLKMQDKAASGSLSAGDVALLKGMAADGVISLSEAMSYVGSNRSAQRAAANAAAAERRAIAREEARAAEEIAREQRQFLTLRAISEANAAGADLPDDVQSALIEGLGQDFTAEQVSGLLAQNDNAKADVARKLAIEGAEAAFNADKVKVEVADTLELINSGRTSEIKDVTLTKPNGSTVTIRRDDRIKAAFNYAFKDMPDGPQKVALQGQWLANSGTAYTDPALADSLTGGFQASLSAFSSVGGEGFVFPAAAIQGFESYKALQSSPGVRTRHMDTQTEDFYRMAETAMAYGPTKGDIQGSLKAAAAATLASGMGANRPTPGMAGVIEEKVSYKDDPQGYNMAYQIAQDFVKIPGFSPASAAEAAWKEVEAKTKVVRGVRIPDPNGIIPNGFEEMADTLLQAEVAGTLKDFGYDASDLTLVPNPNGSGFYIADKNLMPIVGSRTFTLSQIREMADAAIRSGITANAKTNRTRQEMKEDVFSAPSP